MFDRGCPWYQRHLENVPKEDAILNRLMTFMGSWQTCSILLCYVIGASNTMMNSYDFWGNS